MLVWGCFSGHGVGPLIQINGIMDRYQYHSILKDTMLPFAEANLPVTWKFMHDNDPKHTDKVIKDFLEQEQVDVINWPAQSPDLNPLENLWDQLEVAVRQESREKFKNKEELFTGL